LNRLSKQAGSKGVLQSCQVQSGSDVVFKPSGVLSEAEDSPDPVFKSVSGLGETGTGPELVPDMSETEIGSELGSNMGESEIGPEPVPDLDEAGTEPSPVFVESLHDPFINLDQIGAIEKNDSYESDTPIEIIQTKPIQVPTPSARRWFKTPAGTTYLPLICKIQILTF